MDIVNISQMSFFNKPKGKISLSQDILSNQNVIACRMTDQW